MPRSGVSTTHAQGNLIPWEYFVRFDLAATYRYTTHGAPVTLSIDGGPQLWSPYQMTVDAISQDSENPLDVTYVSVGNLDQNWNANAFSSAQFRELPVTVWLIQFDPASYPASLSILGQPQMFQGRVAGADQGADGWLKITLNPHNAPWNALALRLITPTCPYIFKDADTCQYAGVLTSCLRTRSDCLAHSNTQHFGGADWMPLTPLSLTWGTTTVTPTSAPLGPFVNVPPDPPPTLLGNGRAPISRPGRGRPGSAP